jgi:hypothetical protein
MPNRTVACGATGASGRYAIHSPLTNRLICDNPSRTITQPTPKLRRELDPCFREKLMLVVARSNDSKYCSWGQHEWAIVEGVSGEALAHVEQMDPAHLDRKTWLAISHAGAGRCQLRPGVKRTDAFCCALPPLLTFFSRSSKLSIGELVRRMIDYTTKMDAEYMEAAQGRTQPAQARKQPAQARMQPAH